MLSMPPYIPFDPPADGCTISTIRPTPDPNLGQLAYHLSSDADLPVVCRRLTSAGVHAGIPRDRYNQPYTESSVLQVGASVNIDALFSLGGTFADAINRSWLKVYVEEFAPDGSYRGAIQGPSHYIANEGAWFFTWHNSWTVNTQHFSVSADIPVNPQSDYRVWIDLEGEIAATGFRDRIGGSSSHATVLATVENINTFYYLTP